MRFARFNSVVVLLPLAAFLTVQAGADLPVSIQNTGDQLVPDYRVHGAVTRRF